MCEAVKQTCKQGWPNCSSLKGVFKKYASEADHLLVQDGIQLYDDRLVIPTVPQQQILTKLYTGHQGIHKCKQKACVSVVVRYW